MRLGGFALAHAAWSVEDGETLCTLAVLEIDGERELVRYEADSIPESVEAAHADLDARLSGGGVAALVMDTFAFGGQLINPFTNLKRTGSTWQAKRTTPTV